MSDKKQYQDPDYIQGQIMAMRQLILAIAQEIPKEVFRQNALDALERLKIAHLNAPVSDTRLYAIDECVTWVKAQTE